jgi:hypothetical protein
MPDMGTGVQPNLNVNPATNPFNAGVQGVQEASDWAAQQSTIDIKRQQLQMEQEQHQLMKQEFHAKLGSQMMDSYNDFAVMPNESPLKKVKARNWKDTYTNAGVMKPEDADEFVAAAQDPQIQQDWQKLYTNVKDVNDPNFSKQLLAGAVSLFGGKAGLTLFKDTNDKILMAQAMRQRGVEAAQIGAQAGIQKAEIGAGATRERIENVSRRASQRSYDQAVTPIRTSLEGGKRALSLIDEVESAKDPDERLKATKQFRTLLANEEARLVTQKSNYGEGTAANVAIDSFASRAKDLAGKVLDEPEDTVSPENLKQARLFYTELSGQYMNAHDRLATQQLGGATAAQRKAILGRAQQFQKSYAKAFGGWKGEGIQLPPEEQAQEEEPKAAPAAPAQAQPSQVTLTPKALQNAQRIRAKLQSLPPGDEKDNLLREIQRIPPETRQKLGLP